MTKENEYDGTAIKYLMNIFLKLIFFISILCFFIFSGGGSGFPLEVYAQIVNVLDEEPVHVASVSENVSEGPDQIENRLLREAMQQKDIGKVKNILAGDKSISASDKSSCLIDAVCDENHEMAKMLLDMGADANSTEGAEGTTVLLLASGEGNQEMIRLLLARGANINEAGRFGTVLTYAFKYRDLDFMKYLIDKGADVNLFWGNNYDRTPLMTAIGYDVYNKQYNYALLKLLLENMADPNKISTRNNYSTPLIGAVEENDLESVKLLVEHDANLTVQNFERNTALDVARKKGYTSISDFLLKKFEGSENAGAPSNKPPENVTVRMELPVWVVCCEVSDSREQAVAAAARWNKRGFKSDVLWIPDFESLSGAKMWLAYVGAVAYEDRKAASELRNGVKKYYREAYALRLDHKKGREVLK